MKRSKGEHSERQILELLLERLDKLILVTALQGRAKEDQIKYLSALGYSNSEMATMLATPKGTIDGIRSTLMKGKKP